MSKQLWELFKLEESSPRVILNPSVSFMALYNPLKFFNNIWMDP